MKARRNRLNRRPWCKVHHTNDTRLDITCPTCQRATHIHEAALKSARRYISFVVTCTSCHRGGRLMPAQGGKRWELVALDGNTPVMQGRLRIGGTP